MNRLSLSPVMAISCTEAHARTTPCAEFMQRRESGGSRTTTLAKLRAKAEARHRADQRDRMPLFARGKGLPTIGLDGDDGVERYELRAEPIQGAMITARTQKAAVMMQGHRAVAGILAAQAQNPEGRP